MVANTYYQSINKINQDLNSLAQNLANYEKIENNTTEDIQKAKKKLLKTNSRDVAQKMRIKIQNLEKDLINLRNSKNLISNKISEKRIVLEGYEQIAEKLSS